MGGRYGTKTEPCCVWGGVASISVAVLCLVCLFESCGVSGKGCRLLIAALGRFRAHVTPAYEPSGIRQEEDGAHPRHGRYCAWVGLGQRRRPGAAAQGLARRPPVRQLRHYFWDCVVHCPPSKPCTSVCIHLYIHVYIRMEGGGGGVGGALTKVFLVSDRCLLFNPFLSGRQLRIICLPWTTRSSRPCTRRRTTSKPTGR